MIRRVPKAPRVKKADESAKVKVPSLDTVPTYLLLREALNRLIPTLTEEEKDRTPDRFTMYLKEFTQGHDLTSYLGQAFPNEGNLDQMLVETGIPFTAICSHHLLPMVGVCSVGYLPHRKLLGLSKFARLVKAAGQQKPTLQEVVTNDIARTLERFLEPRGVMVVTHAQHMCMSARGIRAPHGVTTSSIAKGAFLLNTQARAEFFELCKQSHASHQ